MTPGEVHTATYRPEVLDALADHGVRPTPTTPPALVRAFLNDLYRWEIRRLKGDLLAGRFPKPEYLDRVIALRRKYLLLSIPLDRWVEDSVVR